MGFLKKIFGRSKKSLASNSSDSTNNSQRRKLSRRERKALKKVNQSGSFLGNTNNGAAGAGSAPQSLSFRDKPKSPRAASVNANNKYSKNKDGVNLDTNTLNMEHNVRKASLSNQSQRQQQQHQQHHRISTSSFSPNSSDGRSPNSYQDIDRNGTASSSYRDPYHNNSSGHKAHQPYGKNSPRDNNHYSDMVHFGGEISFNHSSSLSPSSYQDYNDENTNYNANRKSPPSSQQQQQHHHQYDQLTDDNFSPKSNHSDNNNNNNNNNLQYDHVQRLEKQQQHNSNNNQNNLHPYEIHQSKKMLQLTRLPNGQLVAMERMNNSSPLSTSSDFDLSTDAEDNEYNHMRNTSSLNIQPMLQPHHSPSSEEDIIDDDDDNNLPTRHRHHYNYEDDYGDGGLINTRSKNYFSDSDHDTMNSPGGDSRGNGSINMSISSSTKQPKSSSPPSSQDHHNQNNNNYESSHHDYETPSGAAGGGKSRFTFDNEFEEALVQSKQKDKLRPPSPTAYQKINKTQQNRNNYEDDKSQQTEKSFDTSVMSPRTLAIKAEQNMRHQENSHQRYSSPEYELKREKQFPSVTTTAAQAVDMLPPRTSRSQDSVYSGRSGSVHTNNNYNHNHHNDGTYSQKSANSNNRNKNEVVISNFADFETFANNEFGSHNNIPGSSKPMSPVSELLAQAQANRKQQQNQKSEPTADSLIEQIYKDANMNPYDVVIESSGSMMKQNERQMEKDKFLRMLNEGRGGSDSDDDDDSDKEKDDNESWLKEEVTGALGPPGHAADLESLGERSSKSKASLGVQSHRSHRSHRSNKSYRSHRSSASQRRTTRRSDDSVGSRHSRSSRYSIKSTKSYLSQMSHESRSVANDLIRLEMQLAMVNKNGENEVKKQLELDAQRKGLKDGISVGEHSIGVSSYASRSGKSYRKSAVPKRAKSNVKAPPGKLGIILANRTDSKGTVVSGVRTTSVLADKIAPGDRIIAIDGEDVSRMTVPEITAIMARKSDFERILTVLITPKS